MKEIEFSRWFFELLAKQHSQFSPSGSTFLPCLSLPSKSHRENSISSIFLESPHQVDMKNVVKCQKHFFGYFNALKTHCVQSKHSQQSSIQSLIFESPCMFFSDGMYVVARIYPLKKLQKDPASKNEGNSQNVCRQIVICRTSQ